MFLLLGMEALDAGISLALLGMLLGEADTHQIAQQEDGHDDGWASTLSFFPQSLLKAQVPPPSVLKAPAHNSPANFPRLFS